MSLYALNWAFSIKGISPDAKLALVFFADKSLPDGTFTLNRQKLFVFTGHESEPQLSKAISVLIDKQLILDTGDFRDGCSVFTVPNEAVCDDGGDDIVDANKFQKPFSWSGETNLYLMRNNANMRTKIGVSKYPVTREKTLQSDEPDIEMIFCFPATGADEKALHHKYAHKRIRGEWFDLDDSDIQSIKAHFTTQGKQC